MTAPAKAATNRFFMPFLELLRQGMTPEKISLTIALGIVLGVNPLLGSTTLLCTLAALLLRLNLPAIQLVNGVVYPLQLILLIPFYKAGAWIFHAKASAISIQGITALIRTGTWFAIQFLWVITMHALVAWIVLGLAATALLYAVFAVVVGQLWKKFAVDASDLPAIE